VRAPGFASQEVVTGTDGHRAYDFVMIPEAVVRGRVIDEAGAPIAAASIRITESEPQRAVAHHGLATGAPATATSDDTGTFAVHGLERGLHHIAARAPGLVATIDESESAKERN